MLRTGETSSPFFKIVVGGNQAEITIANSKPNRLRDADAGIRDDIGGCALMKVFSL